MASVVYDNTDRMIVSEASDKPGAFRHEFVAVTAGGVDSGAASAASLANIDADLGAPAEAAASTDTGTFGIIPFIKRALQNWTTLLARMPVSLGAKTGAASLSVVPASDATYITTTRTATLVNRSGTITTGGAAQVLAAANTARKSFTVQNNSAGDLWINEIGGTAVLSQPSLKIASGSMYEAPTNGVSDAAISIIGATTGQTFSAREF